MTGWLQPIGVLLPVGYALAAGLHGMAFGGPRAPQVRGLRVGVLRATLALHLAWFLLRGRTIDHFPVSDVWSAVSAVGFATALLYGWVARRSGHAGSGGIVLGFVFLLIALATAFVDFAPGARPEGISPLRTIHVGTSVIAVAALVLSGIHGALYLLLFREMRERRFGALFDHLPDLERLAHMTRRAALAGFLGLTVGINVGIWMAHRERIPTFDYRDPEVLLSIALWIHFGVIAFSGSIRGFGARRASFAAAGGLVALLASLLLILVPNLSFHGSV